MSGGKFKWKPHVNFKSKNSSKWNQDNLRYQKNMVYDPVKHLEILQRRGPIVITSGNKLRKFNVKKVFTPLNENNLPGEKYSLINLPSTNTRLFLKYVPHEQIPIREQLTDEQAQRITWEHIKSSELTIPEKLYFYTVYQMAYNTSERFNLYRYLILDINATEKEIRDHYKTLVRILHTDKGAGNQTLFSLINHAKDILTNKDEREFYDQNGIVAIDPDEIRENYQENIMNPNNNNNENNIYTKSNPKYREWINQNHLKQAEIYKQNEYNKARAQESWLDVGKNFINHISDELLGPDESVTGQANLPNQADLDKIHHQQELERVKKQKEIAARKLENSKKYTLNLARKKREQQQLAKMQQQNLPPNANLSEVLDINTLPSISFETPPGKTQRHIDLEKLNDLEKKLNDAEMDYTLYKELYNQQTNHTPEEEEERIKERLKFNKQVDDYNYAMAVYKNKYDNDFSPYKGKGKPLKYNKKNILRDYHFGN